MEKAHPTIGCCGIDCGLCPRFYTEGKSRCPGCGGEGFESKHPTCSIKTCCVEKHGLEVCAQCVSFPCRKYENEEKINRDSFVTHGRLFSNHDLIQSVGIDGFLSQQNERMTILKEMLAHFDDGRSKSYYCLAVALLSTQGLRSALAEVQRSKEEVQRRKDLKTRAERLKVALIHYANNENVDLKLKK